MSSPVKEVRLRIRCPECGRIMRSNESRKRGVCSICEPHSNIAKVWARRMKVRDEALVCYMNEKLKPKPPSHLAKLKQVAEQRVEVRGIPELLRFLQKKVELK